MESKLANSIVKLVSGVVLAQIVPVLMSPVLTRLYDPSAFGYLSIYTSFTMIIGIVSLARYEYAILLPRSTHHASYIVYLCCLIVCAMAAFTLIVMLGYNGFASLLGFGLIASYLFFIPADVVTSGIHEALNYWYTRRKKYHLISSIRVVQALTTACVGVVIGYYFKDKYGLVYASYAGAFVSTVFILLLFAFDKHRSQLAFFHKKMNVVARRYSNMPKFYALSSFCERIASQAPVLVLAALFGSEALGFFALAQRVTQLPVKMITRSVSDVFLQHLAEDSKQQSNYQLFVVKMFVKLLLLGLVPFLILTFFAPQLFALVFGHAWRNSGYLAQMMGGMYLLEFVTTPICGVFILENKQKVAMFLQITLLCSTLIALLVGKFYFASMQAAVLGFVLCYCVKYVLEIALCYHYSGSPSYDKLKQPCNVEQGSGI